MVTLKITENILFILVKLFKQFNCNDDSFMNIEYLILMTHSVGRKIVARKVLINADIPT